MAVRTRPDELRRSIRRDLAWSARTGAPPLGHLAGLHRKATDDGTYALALDPDRPLLAGGPGILELAMLADLALGGVIRNQVGLALPMPTISMTLQLAPGRTRDVAWADGECTVQIRRTATARTQLRTSSGEVVGDAVGVFALPAMPYNGPGRAMPWDVPLGTGDRPADQLDDEPDDEPDGAATTLVSGGIGERVVDRIVAHAAGSPVSAWGTLHVEEQMSATDGLALAPTVPMANRLGHIQGGALFTTAVLASARVAEFPVDALVTGTIEFIEAADLDGLLAAEVTVLRAGGRSLFASALLVQGGRTRCHVTTVFRR